MSNQYYTYPVVLTIAGSDSGGGAGIQADLKTFSALGCYGTSAITAITVQNTLGVKAIHAIPVEIVTGQIRAVIEDLNPKAIKIGMVHSCELVEAICSTLSNYPEIPIVFDPVMVATSGDKLLNDDTVALLKARLLPMATLLTPNLDETAVLTGHMPSDLAGMEKAAVGLLAFGCQAVLVKGGHLAQEIIYDLYSNQTGEKTVISTLKIRTPNTHGTGCSLSSAIAANLAKGYALSKAVEKGIEYVKEALHAAEDVKLGHGHGPLNHFYNPIPMIKYEVE